MSFEEITILVCIHNDKYLGSKCKNNTKLFRFWQVSFTHIHNLEWQIVIFEEMAWNTVANVCSVY